MKKIEFHDNAPKIRSTFVLPEPLDHQLEIHAATAQRLKSEVVIDALRSYLGQADQIPPRMLPRRRAIRPSVENP
jgi:hypothetical protein